MSLTRCLGILRSTTQGTTHSPANARHAAAMPTPSTTKPASVAKRSFPPISTDASAAWWEAGRGLSRLACVIIIRING